MKEESGRRVAVQGAILMSVMERKESEDVHIAGATQRDIPGSYVGRGTDVSISSSQPRSHAPVFGHRPTACICLCEPYFMSSHESRQTGMRQLKRQEETRTFLGSCC